MPVSIARRAAPIVGAGVTGVTIAQAFRPGPIAAIPVGAGVDRVGRALVVQPSTAVRTVCPTGYVAVTMPDGSRACMLKAVARSAGLWKARRRPPISAGDWRKLQVAERTKKKAKKVAQTAGFTCSTRGTRRRSAHK